jgi:hypothetical protein
MIVNPAAVHVGAVVFRVGTTGVANWARFVKGVDAVEVQPPLVAVSV